jgi:hypothetical protein
MHPDDSPQLPAGGFLLAKLLSQYNDAKKFRFSAPRFEKSDQSARLSMLTIYQLDATKSEPVGNLIGVDPIQGKYKWYTQNQVIP